MQAIQKGIDAVTEAATGTTSTTSATTSTNEQESKQQSGQEPVSGKQGQGTADKPFDQGNQDGELRGFPL